jgi:sugar-specific transcriptional regulator TrmB
MGKDQKLSAMNLEDRRRALSSMREKMEEHFVELGQLLSEMKKEQIFRIYGYETFREFVEDEFNLAGSLVNKLVSNYKYYVGQLNLDEASLVKIGLDKLSILRPVLKNSNPLEQEQWLQKAEAEKSTVLKEEIKELKEKTKQKSMKDVFTEQFIEKWVTYFNCSRKELMFKLALFFQDSKLEEIEAKISEHQAKLKDEELVV